MAEKEIKVVLKGSRGTCLIIDQKDRPLDQEFVQQIEKDLNRAPVFTDISPHWNFSKVVQAEFKAARRKNHLDRLTKNNVSVGSSFL